jgi:hypothetical protein
VNPLLLLEIIPVRRTGRASVFPVSYQSDLPNSRSVAEPKPLQKNEIPEPIT